MKNKLILLFLLASPIWSRNVLQFVVNDIDFENDNHIRALSPFLNDYAPSIMLDLHPDTPEDLYIPTVFFDDFYRESPLVFMKMQPPAEEDESEQTGVERRLKKIHYDIRPTGIKERKLKEQYVKLDPSGESDSQNKSPKKDSNSVDSKGAKVITSEHASHSQTHEGSGSNSDGTGDQESENGEHLGILSDEEDFDTDEVFLSFGTTKLNLHAQGEEDLNNYLKKKKKQFIESPLNPAQDPEDTAKMLSEYNYVSGAEIVDLRHALHKLHDDADEKMQENAFLNEHVVEMYAKMACRVKPEEETYDEQIELLKAKIPELLEGNMLEYDNYPYYLRLKVSGDYLRNIGDEDDIFFDLTFMGEDDQGEHYGIKVMLGESSQVGEIPVEYTEELHEKIGEFHAKKEDAIGYVHCIFVGEINESTFVASDPQKLPIRLENGFRIDPEHLDEELIELTTDHYNELLGGKNDLEGSFTLNEFDTIAEVELIDMNDQMKEIGLERDDNEVVTFHDENSLIVRITLTSSHELELVADDPSEQQSESSGKSDKKLQKSMASEIKKVQERLLMV